MDVFLTNNIQIGLLPPCNHQQVPFAYKMYTREDDLGWQQSNAFKQTFSIDVDIEFVGVWWVYLSLPAQLSHILNAFLFQGHCRLCGYPAGAPPPVYQIEQPHSVLQTRHLSWWTPGQIQSEPVESTYRRRTQERSQEGDHAASQDAVVQTARRHNQKREERQES